MEVYHGIGHGLKLARNMVKGSRDMGAQSGYRGEMLTIFTEILYNTSPSSEYCENVKSSPE